LSPGCAVLRQRDLAKQFFIKGDTDTLRIVSKPNSVGSKTERRLTGCSPGADGKQDETAKKRIPELKREI